MADNVDYVNLTKKNYEIKRKTRFLCVLTKARRAAKGVKIMSETTMKARPTDAPEPEFYTPEEMAALLRVPKRTLEKWTFQRRLPVVKCGRLNRFPRAEIQKRILSGNLLK